MTPLRPDTVAGGDTQNGPLILKYQTGSSLRPALKDLFLQSRLRHQMGNGARYEEALLLHFLGAVLEVLGEAKRINHRSLADCRGKIKPLGDFVIGGVAFLTATHPSNTFMRRCQRTFAVGLRTVAVFPSRKIYRADRLALIFNLSHCLEVLDIEQFAVTALHRLGHFNRPEEETLIRVLVERYNEAVESCETDISLKIVISG